MFDTFIMINYNKSIEGGVHHGLGEVAVGQPVGPHPLSLEAA